MAYVPLGGALISANGSRPQLTHLEAAVDSSGREIFRNRVSRQPSSSKLARSSGSRGKRPHRFKPKVDCPRFRGSGPGPLRPIDRTLNRVGGKLVDLVRSMAQGHSDVASRVHPWGDKPKDAGGVLWPAGAYYKLLKSVTWPHGPFLFSRRLPSAQLGKRQSY